MDSKEEKKAWREVGYKRKFLNTVRGLHVFFATTKTRDLVIYITATALVVIFGLYLNVSSLEWIALVFCICFVIVAEVFNTAIEIDIDLTSPEYHPYARDTKDVAAAGVLLSVLASIIIACIIFLPKIFNMI